MVSALAGPGPDGRTAEGRSGCGSGAGQRPEVGGNSHVDAVLESDTDNIILGEVSSNRSQTLSDLVSLVGLWQRSMGWVSDRLLPSGETSLV